MRIAKNELPRKIDTPGARAGQQPGFGDASGYGVMGGECFTMEAGTDLTPLLKGLENDMCQAPHWGYLVSGEVTAIYGDGSKDHVRAGDLFYWPPGHTVTVQKDAELVMFSPQHEHTAVMDHVNRQIAG